jgi:hypothetical protein
MDNKIARQTDPENTRDYYVEARNGKKRDYIFDYGESRTCSHPHLIELALGGDTYRCAKCNWAFDIIVANQQSMHNLVIQSMFNMMHFAKEFGKNAFMEVLRTPIGQTDKTAQKPVLPEGMSVDDAFDALEGIDVTTEDGGAEELRLMLEEHWVSQEERSKRIKALQGIDPARRPHVPGLTDTKELQSGDTDEEKEVNESKT